MKVLLILVSVFLGSIGQICFKRAVQHKGSLSLLDAILHSITEPFFYLGIVSYGVSLILWMKILTDTDLSFARPFAGAGYIVTALLAVIMFQEQISIQRWAGIAMIIAGIFLVART